MNRNLKYMSFRFERIAIFQTPTSLELGNSSVRVCFVEGVLWAVHGLSGIHGNILFQPSLVHPNRTTVVPCHRGNCLFSENV